MVEILILNWPIGFFLHKLKTTFDVAFSYHYIARVLVVIHRLSYNVIIFDVEVDYFVISLLQNDIDLVRKHYVYLQ